MSKRTSRALKATATVAGVAALGASFVGTASAAPSGGNSFGGSDSSDAGTPTVVKDQLDGSTSESDSGFEQPGLFTFDMPSLQTDDSGLSDILDISGSDSDSGDQSENFQHPEQYKGNNFGEGDFQILGQSFDEFGDSFGDMNSNNSEFPGAKHDEGTETSQSVNGSDHDSDSESSDFAGFFDGFSGGGDSSGGPFSGHSFTMPGV